MDSNCSYFTSIVICNDVDTSRCIKFKFIDCKRKIGFVFATRNNKKIIGLVILFIAIKYGIIVLCSGYALYCIIEIVTDTYYSGKFYNLGFYAQIKLICPSFYYL